MRVSRKRRLEFHEKDRSDLWTDFGCRVRGDDAGYHPTRRQDWRGKRGFFGYTTIALSALLVSFGVRSYRENVARGRLRFGRGFAVGILITLISSVCYVGT
jgi:Protein of unknown function (DUF4199)